MTFRSSISQHTNSHPTARFRRPVAAAVAGLCAAGALVGVASPAQAAGRVLQVSNTTQLEKIVTTLHPGDVVQLKPGTYDVGSWRPQLTDFGNHAVGTAAAPITITAADPAHRPLIQGALKFDDASHWTFSNLRIQGTVKGTDTLTFNGGTGWALLNSEVFGASATGALANVVVAKIGSWPMPTNWMISGNTIHDAGTNKAKPGMQHEIYLTAVGNTVHGLITKNIFYNTSQGANVKIGNGGVVNSPGISGVQVTNNTMYKSFEQVLLHGNVSNNVVKGNLMILSTRAQGDGNTVGVYLAGVTGKNNVIQNNYFYRVSRPVYNNDSSGSFVNRANPAARPNPQFNTTAIGGFRPRAALAAKYGAYSTVKYWH